MKEVIFLTGSTGFLGSYLLRQLLCDKHQDIKQIIAFSRGKTQKEAERRVHQALWSIFPVRQRRGVISLLRVVKGDITRPNLGLSEITYKSLIKKVTSIYHSAALCEFKIPLEVIRGINVDGTKNVLDFAWHCHRKRSLQAFHHISTIAVGGNEWGILYEKDLNLRQKFNNTYEQSKFEAEKLVNRYRSKGLPVLIYRPAILIGASETGHTSNFRVFYQALHMFSLELLQKIPAKRDTVYSLCPVDYVADAIIRISTDKDRFKNKTYHITNPNETTFGFFIDIASRYLNFCKPKFVSKRKFRFSAITPLQYSLIEPYIPYFNYRLRFDNTNAREILDKTGFAWPKMDEELFRRQFKFCVQSGFVKVKK